MNMPVPNDSEVTDFIAFYRKKTGDQLSRADALDVLTRLVQYVYLTEYYPKRPLREVGWSERERLAAKAENVKNES